MTCWVPVLIGIYGIPPIYSQRISPDCIILDNFVFENLILADELFAKALQTFETCVSVNNNLCEKLLSTFDLPIKI